MSCRSISGGSGASSFVPTRRQLLDRQIVDRDGLLAGKVDDIELEIGADGRMHATALLSGPGTLARRLGGTRLGDWWRDVHGRIDGVDATRVSLGRVADIGDHVTVSLAHRELGSFRTERWVRDHVIGRIPGSRHAPPQ